MRADRTGFSGTMLNSTGDIASQCLSPVLIRNEVDRALLCPPNLFQFLYGLLGRAGSLLAFPCGRRVGSVLFRDILSVS